MHGPTPVTAPGSPARGGFALAALCLLGVAAIYALYYTSTNARFTAGGIAASQVPAELVRWQAWHWLRFALGLAAFVSGVAALRRI